MVAAIKLKKLIFENDLKDTTFEEFATGRLEAIKDSLEMFFEMSSELGSYKAKGFEFRYIPGVISQRQDDLQLLETAAVTTPDGRSHKFGFEINLRKIHYKKLTANVYFSKNINQSEDLEYFDMNEATHIVEYAEATMDNYTPEEEASVVMDYIRRGIVLELDDLFKKIQKIPLKVAKEIVSWLETTSGLVNIKLFERGSNTAIIEGKVQNSRFINNMFSLNFRQHGSNLDVIQFEIYYDRRSTREKVDISSKAYLEDIKNIILSRLS